MTDISYRKYTLLAVSMASFLTPFMGSAINLALPSIGIDFKSNTYLLSWVATSYILASAAFLLPIGRFADITGRKKIFTYGLIIFALTSLFCGFAWSIQALIFFRITQGIGAAMIFGTAMAILTSAFPPQERGKVLGLNVAMVYIGLSAGPVLGGIMSHNFGWQSIFYFTAVISTTVLLLALKIKKEWADAKGEKYDYLGALFYSTGLLIFMYGFSSISSSEISKYLILIGLATLVLFIRRQMILEHPLLNLTLFTKNMTFAFSNLAALINYSATFALGFLLSIYLQVIMHYDAQASGLILLSQPIIMALLSPFAGTLSDRIQPRIVASFGMILITIGLFVFYFISIDTPLWLIIINLILLGIGFAFFSSPNSNAIMSSVEKNSYGIASSTLVTMRLVGQAASMAIVTMVLAFYVGDAELTETSADLLIKGTKVSFLIFSVICFIGVLTSLARGNVDTGNS